MSENIHFRPWPDRIANNPLSPKRPLTEIKSSRRYSTSAARFGSAKLLQRANRTLGTCVFPFRFANPRIGTQGRTASFCHFASCPLSRPQGKYSKSTIASTLMHWCSLLSLLFLLPASTAGRWLLFFLFASYGIRCRYLLFSDTVYGCRSILHYCI